MNDNYEAMSDFEINKEITARLGLTISPEQYEEFSDRDEGCVLIASANGDFDVVDYCNNWNDIMPIAHQFGIAIINLEGTTQWFACCSVRFETVCMSPDGTDSGISSMSAMYDTYDTIPQRAIAICFLKLKDAQNEPR